jgi:hypothetical protein
MSTATSFPRFPDVNANMVIFIAKQIEVGRHLKLIFMHLGFFFSFSSILFLTFFFFTTSLYQLSTTDLGMGLD